jgi:hypothetical protein
MPPQHTKSRILPELVILAGYTLLAIVFTYPLVSHLKTHVVGLTGDSEEYMWAFWWMRTALLDLGVSPFFTYWLYYPQGVSLYFFAFNPLHALLSVPLQLLFGLMTAYNLMALLTFIAAAYATYWLARDVTGSRAAGVVAGIIFAFAPTQFFHFSVGQPNMYAVEFLPIYILCLRRWLSGAGVGWFVGSVTALALSSLADWQFAVYLQLFTGAALLAALLARRHEWRAAVWDLGRRVVALEVVYLLVLLPMLVPMARELTAPDPYMFRGRDDTASHSADLLAFFVPNPEHPLWREQAKQAQRSLIEPGVLVTTVSLSYVALALAVFGALRNWRQARFWVFCGLGFLILSLGPRLRVLGQETFVHLPYELLFQLPVMQISRTPARFVIVAILCLAVLAALGIQSLMKKQEDGGRRTEDGGRITGGSNTFHLPVSLSGRWAIAGLVALLCFELLPAPVRIEQPVPPPAFVTDGTLRDAGALLEIPDPAKRSMYLSTIHGRPVMYGSLSRDNPVGPKLAYLREGLYDDTDEIFDYMQNWRCWANYYNMTHLAIYRNNTPTIAAIEQTIAARIDSTALLQDTGTAALYKLPVTAPNDTCLWLDAGWDRPRLFGDSGPFYRWTAQEATLDIARREPGRVRLQFKTHSFAIPRQLQVLRDAQVIAEFPVGGEPTLHAIELDMPAGMTRLTLRSVEPAVSPADYGYKEIEPIAIGYSELSAESR